MRVAVVSEVSGSLDAVFLLGMLPFLITLLVGALRHFLSELNGRGVGGSRDDAMESCN